MATAEQLRLQDGADDKEIKLLEVNAIFRKLAEQLESNPEDRLVGAKVSKTQFLAMAENFKNCILTTKVAAKDEGSLPSAFKKATIVLGRLLKVLLEITPEEKSERGSQCIRAFVS